MLVSGSTGKVLVTRVDFLHLVLGSIYRILKGKQMYFPRSVSGLRSEIACGCHFFTSMKTRNSARIKTIEGWGL